MAKEPVFVVLQEDRHIDAYVEIWRTQEAAITSARAIAANNSSTVFQENVAGCILYLLYSAEGDCVKVFEKEISD